MGLDSGAPVSRTSDALWKASSGVAVKSASFWIPDPDASVEDSL